MRQFTLQVMTAARRSGGVVVRAASVGSVPVFAPGQAALARMVRRIDAGLAQPFLRAPLYPYHSTAEGFEFMLADETHPYAALSPGDELDVLGPCGRGFELPPRPGHLLAGAASLARLLALLDVALERRWAVALWLPSPSPTPPPDLPEAVEVVRGDLTDELLGWADVVALDMPEAAQRAAEIRARQRRRAAGYVQALADVPMPCGTGACQACWTETGRGRRLACVDGPVIQW